MSEDAVRRGVAKIDEAAGMDWLQTHLDYCVSPLLQEPWVLDVDATIKPLYGAQEGAWWVTTRTSPVGPRIALIPT